MINLLPPIAKKTLAKEYHLRLAVITLCTVFVLELLAVAFFIPAYYILYSSTATLTDVLAQRKLVSPTGSGEIPAQLTGIKDELAQLMPGTGVSETRPSELLAGVLAVKPSGVEFNSFTYARLGGVVTIQLGGIASTREDLLALQKSLRENPIVSDIKYGSSFITQKTDIAFTVTISFK